MENCVWYPTWEGQVTTNVTLLVQFINYLELVSSECPTTKKLEITDPYITSRDYWFILLITSRIIDLFITSTLPFICNIFNCFNYKLNGGFYPIFELAYNLDYCRIFNLYYYWLFACTYDHQLFHWMNIFSFQTNVSLMITVKMQYE